MFSHQPLAFGNREANACHSLLQFAEDTRRVIPSLIGYDAAKPRQFRSIVSTRNINGLPLFATSILASRVRAHVDGVPTATFVYHFDGICDFKVDGNDFWARKGASAVFLPSGCAWVVDAITPSTVVASIDYWRLDSTARTMLGRLDGPSPLLSWSKAPREVMLEFGSISFDLVFRNLFSQIDMYADNQAMLDLSGIDDSLYRSLVIAMIPEVFHRQSHSKQVAVTNKQLDRACQYVMAQLSG